jgi:cysteine-rich repeat protein
MSQKSPDGSRDCDLVPGRPGGVVPPLPVLAVMGLLVGLLPLACYPGEPDPADDDSPEPAGPCAGEAISYPLTAVEGVDGISGITEGASDDFAGSCSEDGTPETLYQFTATDDGTYRLFVDWTTGSSLVVLYAFSDCGDPLGSEVGCSNPWGDESEEEPGAELLFDLSSGQQVTVVVEAFDEPGAYQLELHRIVCGDGVVEGDEVCDDANVTAGDGCAPSCQWECDDDALEDNDSPESATDLDQLGLPQVLTDLSICPTDEPAEEGAGPADLFSLTLGEDEYVVAELGFGDGTGSCDDLLADLSLFSPEWIGVDLVELEEQAGCRRVAAEPGAGTWLIRVGTQDATVAPQSYELGVSTGTATCGDGIAEGTEACDDGNIDGGDGCSADCVEEDASCPTEADLGPILGSEPISGTTQEALDLHQPSCAAAGGPDAAYSFTPATTGAYVFSLDQVESSFDSVLSIRSNCLDPSTEVACADDGGTVNFLNAVLEVELVGGEGYTILVDGYSAGEQGAFAMTIDSL